MDDLALISRIQTRDQEAMLALHARYVNLLYSVAFRILGEATAAEEATQDAFMKVWQNAATYEPERGAPAAWLVRIARNVAIDRLRRLDRRQGLDDSLEVVGEERMNALPNEWFERERLPELKLAVQQLPTDQRQVIALAYFGGMSHQDIADQLQIPLGTVKTRIRLGIQRLKAVWENA
jgi:RNA polymerase sigma-70 factor (ECF subfamily)